MKIPKYFTEWFRIWGWSDDGWNMELWQNSRILRIAWRSYRKGVLDTKMKLGKL
uniref:Uncharacterized protein n=1 Tax=viral metagenome TaxID=1070528 RepID=A0A6H1ZA40_9ZZZZ